eukprot:9108967-Lingulodinium_polyedra.AAC.1
MCIRDRPARVGVEVDTVRGRVGQGHSGPAQVARGKAAGVAGMGPPPSQASASRQQGPPGGRRW